MLQIRNKLITQKLIWLISVVDLPKGTFTLYFNILPFYMCIMYRHPISENEKFCYKPQNDPSVTILLNGVDAFQMNNIMLPS